MSIKAKETKPEIPKLGSRVTVAKWDDSLRVCTSQVFGARNATLEYLLRSNVAVVVPHSQLKTDCLHPAVGSIQDGQTLRLSHDFPLYRDDNKKLYSLLEILLRGTTFDSSINPFKKKGDDRGAYLAQIA